MAPKEEASLRSVYEQWPTDRLARAATWEKKDYEPEAIILMLDELKRRGVAEERLPQLAASLPPPMLPGSMPERSTLLFPARLNRKQYTLRWLIWVVVVVGITFILECIPATQPAGGLTAIVAGYVYKVVGIDFPRMKDAGLRAAIFVILLLAPGLNVVLNVVLFVVPTKKSADLVPEGGLEPPCG